MDLVLGVMKAYTTRVGEGALPTEDSFLAELLHKMGREFGATTGRPRRCGWFDAVATRYATMINGIDELAVTNLDGLHTVDPIPHLRRVSPEWKAPGMFHHATPISSKVASQFIEEMPGWKKSTQAAKKLSDLPMEARNYMNVIAELTGARLKMVSVGPARRQTIVL